MHLCDFWGSKKFFGTGKFFTKNDTYRSNFVQGIDCAHILSMKNYLDPDSGNGIGVKRKRKFFDFRVNTPTSVPE